MLLAVGALTGSLLLSGTIATVVYYGAQFGTPAILYILVFVLASALSLAIGSSFTTIAAVGLPFVALAPSMGVSPGGDRRCRSVGGAVRRLPVADLGHVPPHRLGCGGGSICSPAGPAGPAGAWLDTKRWRVRRSGFARRGQGGFDASSVQPAIESQFSTVSAIAIVPLIVVLSLSARTTGFLSLMAGAASAVVVAAFLQRDLIAQVATQKASGAFGEWAAASLTAMGGGYRVGQRDRRAGPFQRLQPGWNPMSRPRSRWQGSARSHRR